MRRYHLPIIILVACFIILPGILILILSWTDDVFDVRYHYKGESVLNDEQYHIVVGKVVDKEYHYSNDLNRVVYFHTSVNEEDQITVEYDLYSKIEFEYLEGGSVSVFGMVWDLYAPTGNVMFWMVIGIILLGFIALAVIISYKPKALPKLGRRIKDKAISWYDRRFPEMTGAYNIVEAGGLNINLAEVDGLICVRKWNVNKAGILKSIAAGTEWGDNNLHAHKVPGKDDMNGIYGYCIGSPVDRDGRVTGIVELGGKCECHPEGIVRAEYCRVLGFFISSAYKRLGRLLSIQYKVPVCFEDVPYSSYVEWLHSKSGIDSLQHNANILGVQECQR